MKILFTTFLLACFGAPNTRDIETDANLRAILLDLRRWDQPLPQVSNDVSDDRVLETIDLDEDLEIAGGTGQGELAPVHEEQNPQIEDLQRELRLIRFWKKVFFGSSLGCLLTLPIISIIESKNDILNNWTMNQVDGIVGNFTISSSMSGKYAKWFGFGTSFMNLIIAVLSLTKREFEMIKSADSENNFSFWNWVNGISNISGMIVFCFLSIFDDVNPKTKALHNNLAIVYFTFAFVGCFSKHRIFGKLKHITQSNSIPVIFYAMLSAFLATAITFVLDHSPHLVWFSLSEYIFAIGNIFSVANDNLFEDIVNHQVEGLKFLHDVQDAHRAKESFDESKI